MTTYKDQIEATKAAHMAARALSDAAYVKLESLAQDLSSGRITIDKYAAESRKIVRFSYRESATVARSLTKQQSGLSDWRPEGSVSTSDYLSSLIDDVNKNIAEYKAGEQDEKALRRLKLRVRLSATTAAQRGFTDAQLENYGELQEKGFKVSKLWLANFLNNDPCENCKKLHGTEVEFGKEFPVPTLMKVSVYRDLQGPPLHVHCKCMMVVLISRPENRFDVINTNRIKVPTTMSTETVKRLPRRVFDAIIRALRAIVGGKKK
jgi:hypothetical protein